MSKFMRAYNIDAYDTVCESTLRYIYAHESGEIEITTEGFKEKLKNAGTAIWNTIKKWIDKVWKWITNAKNWIIKHWNAFVAKFKGGAKVPNQAKTAEAQKKIEQAVEMIVKQQQADIANVNAQTENKPEVKSDNFYEAIDEVLDEVAELQQEAEQNPDTIENPEAWKKYMDTASKQVTVQKKCVERAGVVFKIDKHGHKSKLQSRASRALKLGARTISKGVNPIKATSKSVDFAEAGDFASLNDDDDGYEGTAV